MLPSPSSPLVVLSPVYNDWAAAQLVLDQLVVELGRAGMEARVLFVDDGSADPAPGTWNTGPGRGVTDVSVLTLRRNVGHQRAIAIGLAYLEERVPCDIVVVMDSDGEDSAADLPALVKAVGERPHRKIVFAGRSRRSEGLVFRFFYFLYRQLYRLLTGREIRAGNFSVLPHEMLQRVVAVSEIWIHYASGLYRARLPCTEISTSRARRLAGSSRMNFVALVTHGPSAIAVYSDVLGTRLMVASGIFGLLIVLLLATVVVVRVATPLGIPGWATTATGLLLVMLAQGIMFSLFFAFIVLNARNSNSFLPCRDYHHFVLSCEPAPGQPTPTVGAAPATPAGEQ